MFAKIEEILTLVGVVSTASGGGAKDLKVLLRNNQVKNMPDC